MKPGAVVDDTSRIIQNMTWGKHKAYVISQHGQQGTRPSWTDYLHYMRLKGLYLQDKEPTGPMSEAEFLAIWQATKMLYDSLDCDLSSASSTDQMSSAWAHEQQFQAGRRRKEELMRNWDGELHLDQYKSLPLQAGRVDIIFTCLAQDARTGLKQFMCTNIWEHDYDKQHIYTRFPIVESIDQRKPGLYELKRSIHCSILCPAGMSPVDKPFHPFMIRVLHRWGKESFDAVQKDLAKVGIKAVFQTRVQAVNEAREQGKDPDGLAIEADDYAF